MAGSQAPASSGFAQGLLGSLAPWMTGANPSALDNSFQQYGGFGGLLDAMLQSGLPQSNQFGSALERAQTNALANASTRQSLAQQGMGLQVKSAMLPLQLAMMRRYYGGMLPAQNSGQNPGAAPTAQDAPSLIRATPQQLQAKGQPVNLQQSQAPDPFAVPTPQQIASIPIGGIPPGYGSTWAFINNKDPVAAAMSEHDAQVKLAQQKYGPILAQLDTLDKAQSPTKYVSANPSLQAEWQKIAPTLGYDPAKDFKDANVRTAFTFLRNRIAGGLGEASVAPPVQMSQVAGPLNSLYNRNPVTNALTQVRGEEQLKPVVDGNGNVSYVPASQAAGQTPFNAETYVNPKTTEGVASLIAHYQYPADRLAYAMRTPQGQAIMAEVKKLNPDFDASTYNVKQKAREAFATGKQGDIVRSLSVATNHLDQLSQAADALAQHNFPTFNRLVNAIGVHITGANPVTNFNAMKEIVGDEVVKAVIGSSGAEGDRQAIKDAFEAARSPEQIDGVIQKYEGLMAGQLSGLRRQYQKATGLNDFNSFVSTMAQRQLSGARATPTPLNVGQSTTVGQFTVTRVR